MAEYDKLPDDDEFEFFEYFDMPMAPLCKQCIGRRFIEYDGDSITCPGCGGSGYED